MRDVRRVNRRHRTRFSRSHSNCGPPKRAANDRKGWGWAAAGGTGAQARQSGKAADSELRLHYKVWHCCARSRKRKIQQQQETSYLASVFALDFFPFRTRAEERELRVIKILQRAPASGRACKFNNTQQPPITGASSHGSALPLTCRRAACVHKIAQVTECTLRSEGKRGRDAVQTAFSKH